MTTVFKDVLCNNMCEYCLFDVLSDNVCEYCLLLWCSSSLPYCLHNFSGTYILILLCKVGI